MRTFVALVADVYHRFAGDAGTFLAATISYYALFSIFPVLLLAISAAGFFLAQSGAEGQILDYTATVLPQFSQIVRSNVTAIAANRQSTGIIGLVGLFWAGTAVFDAIAYAMNRVWDVDAGRPFIFSKMLSAAGVIIVILLLLLTTLASTGFEAFQAFWRENIAVAPPLAAFRVGAFFAGIGLTFLAMLTIYLITPNKELHLRDVWPGAVLAALGLEAGKRLFVLYTARVARFNAIYGSVGMIVGLLFWLYIFGIILVLGAEINAARKAMKPTCEKHSAKWRDRRTSS